MPGRSSTRLSIHQPQPTLEFGILVKLRSGAARERLAGLAVSWISRYRRKRRESQPNKTPLDMVRRLPPARTTRSRTRDWRGSYRVNDPLTEELLAAALRTSRKRHSTPAKGHMFTPFIPVARVTARCPAKPRHASGWFIGRSRLYSGVERTNSLGVRRFLGGNRPYQL